MDVKEFEKALGIEIDQEAYKAFVESFRCKFGDIEISIKFTKAIHAREYKRRNDESIFITQEITKYRLIGDPEKIHVAEYGLESR